MSFQGRAEHKIKITLLIIQLNQCYFYSYIQGGCLISNETNIIFTTYSRYIYNTGSTHGNKYNQFRCSRFSDLSPIQNNKITHPLFYVFYLVIPWRLNFICRRFGTLFHLHRLMKMEQTQYVPKRRHIKYSRRANRQ